MRRTHAALAATWIAVACACGPPEPDYYGNRLEQTKPVVDFTLSDEFGEPFSLSDFRG